MCNRYIGITIGPIVKTLILTTTPAGLWGASYIFSYYTKKLIENLKQDLKISEAFFLVPASSKGVDKVIKDCPWAGLFHDRIIFQAEESIELTAVSQCIEKAKEALVQEILDSPFAEQELEIAEEYIKDYLQVQAIEKEIIDKENPILVLSLDLDSLELGQSYISKEDKNYILKFLENRNSLEERKAEDRNINIKNFTQNINKDVKWHFLDGNRIITIDDIAGIAKEDSRANTQTKNYFALVKTDGDNLGKVLRAMKEENITESIQNFSEKCFLYAKAAFDQVEAYGGKMIYAGGDDLLFIAPVKNQENTVFHLLADLNDAFIKNFESFSFEDEGGQQKKMGFSAGVVLCYYKYPLQEALRETLTQLDCSKAIVGKNTISVHFEKHSGKQRGIQFKDFFKTGEKDEVYQIFLALLNQYGGLTGQSSQSSEFLRSVGKKLQDYQKLFVLALTKDSINSLNTVAINLFAEYPNIFDEMDEDKKPPETRYIENIIELLRKVYAKNVSLKIKKTSEEVAIESLQEVETIIGLLRFYNEKEIR